MDEENISQALIIGVSTFILIMVISAIIAFYNSGVRIVKNVGAGNDFSTVSRSDVESTLLMSGTGNYIKGTDVINLINYYVNNPKVVIMVQNIKYVQEDGSIGTVEMLSIDSEDTNIRNSGYNNLVKYIMDNQDFTIFVNNIEDGIGSSIITIEGV